MDKEAWPAVIDGVAKSRTQLSDWTELNSAEAGLQYIAFPNLEPAHCSMSGSNCCFLTFLQVSQEAGKVVWYSHLFKNFQKPQMPCSHWLNTYIFNNLTVFFLEMNRLYEFICWHIFYIYKAKFNQVLYTPAFNNEALNAVFAQEVPMLPSP